MAMRNDRVKERPLMPWPPTNYQHHTDEWKCRQFAAMFPSRDMDEAVKFCEAGYDTWHHLYIMILETSLVAAEEVTTDGRGREPECNSPEHSGIYNSRNEISDRWYPR